MFSKQGRWTKAKNKWNFERGDKNENQKENRIGRKEILKTGLSGNKI